MKAVRVFRLLLVLAFFLGLCGVIYPYLDLYASTEDLEIILSWNGYGGLLFDFDQAQMSGFNILILLAVVVTLVVHFVGAVGAFFIKKWGRTLVLISSMMLLVFLPFTGLQILLPIENFMFSISGAAFYIAMTLSFTAPLKDQFEGQVLE